MDALRMMLEHGGIGTYLIAVAAILLLVIGAERLYTLYVILSHDTSDKIEDIRAQILSQKYTAALQVCNSSKFSPNLNVVKSALLSVEHGREAMRSALGASILEINHKCEKRLQYLSLIANVATLLGLLGTITGLIKTFSAIATADASLKAQMLGLGISEAMYATLAGLVVGITAMVVHTICVSKSDQIVGQAQDVGYKVITWVEQSERAKKDA